MSRTALFEGLVFDERERPLATTRVGDEASYIVDDDGFKRHVPAEEIDLVILSQLREQILNNKQAVTEGAMKMMGTEDLFTKAMIDSSLKNIDENFRKLMDLGLPESARQWLGMLGFKITVNYHGEIVDTSWPSAASGEE